MLLIGAALGLLAWLGMRKPASEAPPACPVD
jgi:hypothetical protein